MLFWTVKQRQHNAGIGANNDYCKWDEGWGLANLVCIFPYMSYLLPEASRLWPGASRIERLTIIFPYAKNHLDPVASFAKKSR